MFDVLYLTCRYMLFHRVKTVTLIVSVTLILFVPAGLEVVVRQTERQLTARADSTPLIVGARGSGLDLVLNAIYFDTRAPRPTTMSELRRVEDTRFADAIPIHTGFTARSFPVVGTTTEYFALRGLRIASGRPLDMLGECVVGASVARELGLGVDHTLLSDPENPFDLAGVYPLKMRVVAVLAPTGSPDDQTVFVELETAWIIAGIGHGHRNPRIDHAASLPEGTDAKSAAAGAAIVPYTEITENNVGAFHFHGDRDRFPITAVIAVPHDDKSSVLLRGRYLADDDPAQIVVPSVVIGELLATILRIRSWILVAALIVGGAALLTLALVFVLSIRLRQREITTMEHIGCSRNTVTQMIGAEMGIVVLSALALAAVLTMLTAQIGPVIVRWAIA